jgi:hypothetical protein
MSIRLRGLLLVSALFACGAFAQVPSGPRVISARGSNRDGAAGLGGRITVKVRNFEQLLQQANGNCKALVLYLGESPLTSMPPEACDRTEGEVTFVLDRVPDDEKNDAAWHRLLGHPTAQHRPVRVNVGAGDQYFIPTDVTAFPLFLLPPFALYIYMALLLVFVAAFVRLAQRSNIIRAPLAPPTGGRPPYSLSRFQLAFWFILVAAGYALVWIVTGELDTITQSILALIGIGSGTALGAALIDTPNVTDQKADTAPPPPPPPAYASQGFLNDVLSDPAGGVSIHRFQMFVWTLILGVIFVVSVYRDLSMPEFSTTLLGLMGISSGTYLGFKFPEKKNQQAVAENPSASPDNPKNP